MHHDAGCEGETTEKFANALNSGLDNLYAMMELQKMADEVG